ncbi:MAG: hypothetical protein ACI8WI_002600 [Pseudoalteromonas distincta]|jgi:hypothetical protein
MALKLGPKPIADSTGKPDKRRRDNKNTPGNTPGLKPNALSSTILSIAYSICFFVPDCILKISLE